MARIIGLDIDEGYIAAVDLSKKAGGICLNKFAVLAGPKEIAQQPWLKGAGVIINLPAQVVLLRSFHLSPLLKNKQKEKEFLAFLQRQNLPFKLEECFWNTFALNSNLNLIAARKEVVEKYIAQVEAEGLRCQGVTVSLAALYNVFIYNYPGIIKNRFAVLNLKTMACDLLIYDSKRIWFYPLPIGKKDLDGTAEAFVKFSTEVQRTFNTHSLQNPGMAARQGSLLYLCGQDRLEELASALKKVLPDFEVTVSDPFKKIKTAAGATAQAQKLSLSVGLGLTYLGVPGGINLNLIQERVKRERGQLRFNILRKAAVGSAALAVILLLFWNAALLKNLQLQLYAYNETEVQITQVMPEVKNLKEEKAKFDTLEDYLAKKVNQQVLYLKSLAVISESKSAFIGIKELEISNLKDASLQVFLSGSAPTYDEINSFLSNLKKHKDLQEVKVVASTFTVTEREVKAIDFKLRFEIE